MHRSSGAARPGKTRYRLGPSLYRSGRAILGTFECASLKHILVLVRRRSVDVDRVPHSRRVRGRREERSAIKLSLGNSDLFSDQLLHLGIA